MSENLRSPYLVTNNYLQFEELCDLCRREKVIGLCLGRPGVGKTEAAKRYSQWSKVEPYLSHRVQLFSNEEVLSTLDTVYYVPQITVTPTKLKADLARLRNQFNDLVEKAMTCSSRSDKQWQSAYDTLIIVDDAYRLRYEALEELKDIRKKRNIGMVLIGDLAMSRRLHRQPHFVDRVAFEHNFHQLSFEDANQFVDMKLAQVSLSKPQSEVYSAIYWYTQGNPRTLNNLFVQIARLKEINEMTELTRDLVDTAREMIMYNPLAAVDVKAAK